MDQHQLNLQRAVREQHDKNMQEAWDKRREHDDMVELLQQQLRLTNDRLKIVAFMPPSTSQIAALKRQIDERDVTIENNRKTIAELKDYLKRIRKQLEKTSYYN